MLRHYSVKLSSGWKDSTEAALQVSLKANISEMIRGSKLRDSLDKLKERIGPTALILVDTLHRHDYNAQSPDEAETFARTLGDKWLHANAEFIGNTPVCRWNQVLALPAYPAYQRQIDAMEHQDEQFRQCIQEDVDRYFENREKTQEAVEASRRFIKEEIAGFLAYAEGRDLAYFYHGSFMRSLLYADEQMGVNIAQCPISCKRLKNPYPISEAPARGDSRRQNER